MGWSSTVRYRESTQPRSRGWSCSAVRSFLSTRSPSVIPAQWSITAHSPNSGVIASTTTSARSERETAWKREESRSGYRDGSTKVTVSLPRFRLEKVRSDSVPFLPSPFA